MDKLDDQLYNIEKLLYEILTELRSLNSVRHHQCIPHWLNIENDGKYNKTEFPSFHKYNDDKGTSTNDYMNIYNTKTPNTSITNVGSSSQTNIKIN